MRNLFIAMSALLILSACKKEDDNAVSTNAVEKRSLTYVKTIGGIGSGLQELNRLGNENCRDFEEDGQYFYICDHTNGRVKRLNKDFVTQDWYGYKDTAYGIFINDGASTGNYTSGVRIKNNVLYISQSTYKTAYMDKLNLATGERIGHLTFTSLANDFSPVAQVFDVDSKGNIYFLYNSDDALSYKLYRFDNSGNQDASFDIEVSSLASVKLDENDNIYVSVYAEANYTSHQKIRKYNTSGALLTSWRVGTIYDNIMDYYNGKIYAVVEEKSLNSLTGMLCQYSTDGQLLAKYSLDQWENSDMVMYDMGNFKVTKEAVVFVTDDQNKLAVFSMTDQ